MEKSRALRRNVEYAALQGLYWMIYCVAISYAGVYLLSKDYTNAQIGVIIAVGNIGGLLLQLPVAKITDHSRCLTPVSVISILSLSMVSMLVVLMVLQKQSLAMTCAFVLFIAIELSLQPLINAFAFYLERMGTSINFGLTRANGSLAFAVLSAILGYLTQRFGVLVIPAAGLLILLLMLLLMVLFHHEGRPQPLSKTRTGRQGSFFKTLMHDRSLLFLLIGTVFMFYGHVFFNGFTIQMVKAVDGTSADMGALCAFSALVELPVMCFFSMLLLRFSCVGMLKVSAIFFLIKIIVYFFSDSMTGLYAATALQGLSYALFTPAAVRYIHEVMNPEDANRGQASITVVATTSSIISSALGGVLIDTITLRGALGVCAAVTVVGTALVVFGMKKAPVPA